MWRSQLKASSGYAIGNVARSAALVILTPYLINVLTPEDYGAWAYLEVVIVLLNMLMLAGLDIALMREYWVLDDEGDRSALFGTILIGVIVWGGLPALALSAASAGVAGSLLPGPAGVGPWVFMIGWVESILAAFLALFRIRENVLAYVLLSVGRMVLFMGLAIGWIQAGYGVSGGLAGRLVASLVILVIALALVSRAGLISVRWDGRLLKRGLRYGLPLLPANLAAYVLFASDRYFLERLAGLESVAVYSFSYKAASILEMLITRPFAADWAARRFKIAGEEDAPLRYSQVLTLFSFAVVGFGLILLAVAPFLYRIFAPSIYWDGLRVVPLILGAYILFGLSYPLNVGIMLKDRTSYLPFIGWAAAGLCLILNLVLIPRYGMFGAAWATIVAYSVNTAGITWASLRIYRVPYSLRQVGLVLGFGGLGYLALKLLGYTSPASATLAGTVLIAGGVSLLTLGVGYLLWVDFRRSGLAWSEGGA